MPIAIFFTGLLLWLTGKLVDARQTLGAAVMIASWAFVPRIIGSVAAAIQLRMMGPANMDGMYRISTGPARFLDPDASSPLLLALAGRFDVFVLWTTLLLAIGLSVVAKIPRASGWMAAVGVWVLGGLPALYGAMR